MEDKIRNNFNFLSTNLTNIESVLIQLFENGIVSENEMKTVQLPNKTSLEKNSELWLMLNKKGWVRIQSCVVNILRKTSNEHCVEVLTGVSENKTYRKERPNILKNKWWPDRKDLVISFCPRKKGGRLIVEQLHDILTSSDNPVSVISGKVTICGLGGIGKSSTAKWYAQHFEDEYDQIIWIDCEGNSLLNSFKNLARDLHIKEYRDIEFSYLTIGCYEKLADVKCLFIFDNAESYLGERGIKSALPPSNSNFQAIITSRHTEWGHPNGHGYIPNFSLDVFNTIESCDFFTKNLYDKVHTDSQLKHLAICLGNLPLALQIAVAMLNKTKMDLGNYIQTVENSVVLLDKTFDDYEKSINTTMCISLEQIKADKNGGELADQILTAFAYLSSDYIPNKFFMAILGVNEEEFELSLHLLQSYSLITTNTYIYRDSECIALNIHRLLQQVIRRSKGNEALNTLKRILQSKGFLGYKAIPYNHTVNLNSFELDELKEEIENFDGYRLHLVERISLQNLLAQKRYPEAVVLSQLFYNSFDTSDREYLACKYNYAFCLELSGNWEDSLLIFENIYEQKHWVKNHCRIDNLDILSVHNLQYPMPLHYKYLIGIKCFEIYIDCQCFSKAVKYFVDTVHYFRNSLLSWQGIPFYLEEIKTRRPFLIQIGVVLSADYFRKRDYLQTKYLISVTALLVKGPWTTYDLWNKLCEGFSFMTGNNEDIDEYLHGQLYQSQKHIRYGELYPIKFNNFGKQSCLWNFWKRQTKCPYIAEIRKLAFGIHDDFYKSIVQEKQQSLDDRKEVSLFGRKVTPDLDCYSELLNLRSFSSNLKRLVLVRLRVFRADFIYSLVSCVNLNTLILLEISLVGGCCQRIHLPKLQHFRGNFLQTHDVPMDNLLFFKFFFKVRGIGLPANEWMDVLSMDLFHITCQNTTIVFQSKSTKSFVCNLSDYLDASTFKHFNNLSLLKCHVFGNDFSCLSSLKLGPISFIDSQWEKISKISISEYFDNNLQNLNLEGEQFFVDVNDLKELKSLHLKFCYLVIHEDRRPNTLRDISLKYTKFVFRNDELTMVDVKDVFDGFKSVNILLLQGRNMSVELNKFKVSSVELSEAIVLNCDKTEKNNFVFNKIHLQAISFRNSDGNETDNLQFLYGFRSEDLRLQFNSNFNQKLKFSIELQKFSATTKYLSIYGAHLMDNNYQDKIILPNLETLLLDLPSSAEIPNLLACRQLKKIVLSAPHSICHYEGRLPLCREPKVTVSLDKVPSSVTELVLENVAINKAKDFPFKLDKLQFDGHLYENSDYFGGQMFKTSLLVVSTEVIYNYLSKNQNKGFDIFKLIPTSIKECATIIVGNFWLDSDRMNIYSAFDDEIIIVHPYYVYETQTRKWRGISTKEYKRFYCSDMILHTIPDIIL